LGVGRGNEEKGRLRTTKEHARNMLPTSLLLRHYYGAATVLLRCGYGAAMVLRLLLRRGHSGAGPLERVFPSVEDLPRAEEDPRTASQLNGRDTLPQQARRFDALTTARQDAWSVGASGYPSRPTFVMKVPGVVPGRCTAFPSRPIR